MDGDRKYKQNGYMDTGSGNGQQQNRDQQKPRHQGPRPSLDITGPRLPRLVQTVTASRCYNCAATLPAGTDMKSNCPNCHVALHCCKQCAHFEPSTRFQCLKPIPERIAHKDRENECESFSPKVTVARDVKPVAPSNGSGRPYSNGSGGNGNGQGDYVRLDSDRQRGTDDRAPRGDDRPKSAQDARAAFDSLFKKP